MHQPVQHQGADKRPEVAAALMKSTNPLAKDPICGMVVPRATALSALRAGRTYYFCSQGCRQTFLAPEQQLRRMRRRRSIIAACYKQSTLWPE